MVISPSLMVVSPSLIVLSRSLIVLSLSAVWTASAEEVPRARLHGQMAAYNALGIEVRYAALPSAGIPSESYGRTDCVWCADDPREAIGEAKLGCPVETRRCENPAEARHAAGRRIGISGAPAIVLADGSVVPGYVPPECLLGILESGG
jgi:thiol:disulfide interchange protein DsbC